MYTAVCSVSAVYEQPILQVHCIDCSVPTVYTAWHCGYTAGTLHFGLGRTNSGPRMKNYDQNFDYSLTILAETFWPTFFGQCRPDPYPFPHIHVWRIQLELLQDRSACNVYWTHAADRSCKHFWTVRSHAIAYLPFFLSFFLCKYFDHIKAIFFSAQMCLFSRIGRSTIRILADIDLMHITFRVWVSVHIFTIRRQKVLMVPISLHVLFITQYIVACHLPRGSKLRWREDMGGGLPNTLRPRIGWIHTLFDTD